MSRLPFDDEDKNPKPTVPRVPEVPTGSKGVVSASAPAGRSGATSPKLASDPASVGGRNAVPTVPVPAPPTRTVLTVSELNATIRDILENQLQTVWVEGEVSNARVWNTGHMYFTLKDGASQIKAVMFRSAVRYLKFKPEDGLKVVARGKVSVYDPKG
jgi:hypothetical protein